MTSTQALHEKGRSKLLYAVAPRRFSLRAELAKGLKLWREGDFEDLLLRVEAQLCVRLGAENGRRGGEAGRAAALRDKILATADTYRKAMQGLTSEAAQLSSQGREAWGRKLFPNGPRA